MIIKIIPNINELFSDLLTYFIAFFKKNKDTNTLTNFYTKLNEFK